MPYAVPLINKFSYKKMRKSAGNHFFKPISRVSLGFRKMRNKRGMIQRREK